MNYCRGINPSSPDMYHVSGYYLTQRTGLLFEARLLGAPMVTPVSCQHTSNKETKWRITEFFCSVTSKAGNPRRNCNWSRNNTSDILLSALSSPLHKSNNTQDSAISNGGKDRQRRHLLRSSGISFWDILLLWLSMAEGEMVERKKWA